MATNNNAVVQQPSATWHSESPTTVTSRLETDPRHGLEDAVALERAKRSGPNALSQEKKEPWWEEAFESLTEPLQLLLIAVAAVYFWLGETEDAITILTIILIVAAIEVTSELRAKRAVAALSSLAAPIATVIRSGSVHEIPARDIVAGDIVLLSAGVRVPADVRLLETTTLRVDESSLTGESVPVVKNAGEALSPQTPLAERTTMAYSSTLVTSGKGMGVVVGTGADTEVGRIAGLVRQAREPKTPLQTGLDQLSKWLVWVALGFSVLVPLMGVLLAGRPVREMVLVGLTLAFATIPEELPILITMVLGLGAFRLAKRNAIVRSLRAAETLGSVSIVVTDKTGTLTENKMRLVAIIMSARTLTPSEARNDEQARLLLTASVLANDAQLTQVDGKREFVGDPTETALLAGAVQAGMDPAEIRSAWKLLEEYAFTDERKRMSAIAQADDSVSVFAKGSPESILSVCTAVSVDGVTQALDEDARARLQADAESQAANGRRMLGVAVRSLSPAPAQSLPSAEEAERGMTFCGLVALEDPPRAEAAAAVDALQRAGVRVLMVTGDHPATARAIALQVRLAQADQVTRADALDNISETAFGEALKRHAVFARATPEHKLRIVESLQRSGEIVAVTGDGVNDAPALKQAAIGVAMGRAGTDVARESASLVLADDNFATVTEAVRTGRVLYANLRKAVRYYLAAKVALVFASLAAVLLKLPIPFEPVHIILMELFMDLGASVTFIAERAEEDVMARPPRDAKAAFMDRSMQFGIWLGGLTLGVAVLVGYLGALSLGASSTQAQTAAFIAWMVGHVVLAANMRSERQPLLSSMLIANKPFLIWAAAAFVVVAVGLNATFVEQRLHLVPPPAQAIWLAIGAAILLPFLWEPWKWLRGARERQSA